MQARLSLDILANPGGSRFVRTGRGLFFLRELLETTGGSSSKPKEPIEEYIAVRREAPPASENVLVIHRKNYEKILDFQGISVGPSANPIRLTNSSIVRYLPRTVAETLDDYKQFVTYTIIQHNSSILSFSRGRYNRAASFLRGARCIGFGGHVTDGDYSLFSLGDRGIRANAAREISEELYLPSGRPQINPDSLQLLGMLNDDSSDVGVRHVAIVLRYWVDDIRKWRNPSRGESSINQIKWIDTSTAPINLSDFEYWSQLCIRSFFPSYLNMNPSYRVVRRHVFREPHLLCVAGAIGSGKSATTRALVEQGGYFEVNSGRVLANLLGLRPVPETGRRAFQEAAQAFIATPDGPRKLGFALAQAARATNSPKVVIDGIRHPETLAVLREQSSMPVAVMYVYTPPDVAFDMYRSREDYGDISISFLDFVKLYNAPVEGLVKYILSEADIVLYNWAGLHEYHNIVREMMNDIGITS